MFITTTFLFFLVVRISSEVITLTTFGQKDARNPGAVVGVYDIYGILQCARKCELTDKCTSFNFNPSFLLCELIQERKIESKHFTGWWHFPTTTWLARSCSSKGVAEQTCGNGKRTVKLTSGNTTCLDIELSSDCQEVKRLYPASRSWSYRIHLTQFKAIDVFCDMENNGGGWTVFQSRKDGSVDFYKTWSQYKVGFGDLTGEFWLGNDNLHHLLSMCPYILRVDMEDFDGNQRYAEYSTFSIADEAHFYKITIGGYTGNAGDSASIMNGYYFSTKDADFDTHRGSCSILFKGGWWYYKCHISNLNGLYHQEPTAKFGIGVVWSTWKGLYYSLKTVSMKVKRKLT